MINKKELRIGNYIKYNRIGHTKTDYPIIPSEIDTIKEITFEGVTMRCNPHEEFTVKALYQHLAGIPITEEWPLF